jgi:hypothetical protein
VFIISDSFGMATNNTTDNNINDYMNESFNDYECEDKWVYTDDNSLMEKPSGVMESTVFVSNIAEQFGNLSIEAQKFIENHFEKNTIRRIRENMEPDGFCEDGPEAEMWDLYVQTNDDKVHIFSYYHNWNHGKRDGYKIDE